MDKAKIAQFSDTLREKLLQETLKRADHYGILPGDIRDVDGEFEDSIVIDGGVSNKRIKQQRGRLVKEVQEKSYDPAILILKN